MIAILDQHGNPMKANGHARQRTDPMPGTRLITARQRYQDRDDVLAAYDLAYSGSENSKHWSRADRYDSDSANSKWVRGTMVSRSRYESENNGILCGLQRTDATFVARTGPRLRLAGDEHPDGADLDGVITDDEKAARDAEWTKKDKIKRDWAQWCKAIQFRRKLWCMAHAYIQDGEAFGMVRYNPNVAHEVKLDVVLFETEQCQTPMLPFGVEGYIDGIRFDPWGNPIYYDVLPTHPGAMGIHKSLEPDSIPAKYVMHWFLMERPGQHRGVPAFKSTIGLGAVHRRYRQAVVDGAETAANISMVSETDMPPPDDDSDYAVADGVTSFSTAPIQRNSWMFAPMGWKTFQPRVEQPNSTYDGFMRSHIQELARPRSMPYNIAAADSSNSNFASGKLDLFPYYMVVDDVDREDCNDLVMDKVFPLWWQEYVLLKRAKGELMDEDPSMPPEHSWDWPRNPIADEASEVRTNSERLRTGQAAPQDIAHADGGSFEELLRRMARDYGKTVDEIREALFQVNIAPKSGGVLEQSAVEESEDEPPLSRVMQSLGLKKPAAKQPARPQVKNRVQPEQNGVDAPTVEQLSMLIGTLAIRVNDLCAIVAEQKRADDGKFAGDGGTVRHAKSDEVNRAEQRLNQRMSEADEPTRQTLKSVFNQSELDLARRGESSAVSKLLQVFGDSTAKKPALEPGTKVKLNLWKGASAFGTLERNADGSLSVKLEKAEGIDPKTLKKKLPATGEDIEQWLGSLGVGVDDLQGEVAI